MTGAILYPLNELKDIYPELYRENVGRYVGREEVMEQRIPPLNCMWNDVLHLSAVHPTTIDKELAAHGRHLRAKEFYEIDPFTLDPKNTIVYLNQWSSPEERLSADSFLGYDPHNIATYDIFPDSTREYYAEKIALGEYPLLWHGIPHILYKGRIDIKDATVIDLGPYSQN